MSDVQYNDFVDKIIEKEKAKEQEFNVFTALHNVRDEKRLHSRFISFLLSPQSKHGMKSEFLKLFVQNVPELEKHFVIDDNCEVYPNEQDKSEKYDIDILILNKDRKQAIIIENKIDAGDSDHNDKEEGKQIQLERYYNEIKEIYEYDDVNIFIVYLTIDGRKPQRCAEIKSFEEEKIQRLDYREIRNWLVKCEKITKNNVFLNTIIQQYKDITEKIAYDAEKVHELQFVIGENWETAYKNKDQLFKLEYFKHVQWHTIYDFWNELRIELGNKELDKFTVDQITNVAYNKSGTTTSIAFHKNSDQILYIANDSNGLTLGNLTIKKWDYFPNERLKKIKFSDFKNPETFKMINNKERKKVINEILNVIENFPHLRRSIP